MDISSAKMSYDRSSSGVEFPDYARLQGSEAEDLSFSENAAAEALELPVWSEICLQSQMYAGQVCPEDSDHEESDLHVHLTLTDLLVSCSVKQSLITNVATTDPLASVAPTDPLAERKTKDKFQLTSG